MVIQRVKNINKFVLYKILLIVLFFGVLIIANVLSKNANLCWLFSGGILIDVLYVAIFFLAFLINVDIFNWIKDQWIEKEYLLDGLMVFCVNSSFLFFTDAIAIDEFTSMIQVINTLTIAILMNFNLSLNLLMILAMCHRYNHKYFRFVLFSCAMTITSVLYFASITRGLNIEPFTVTIFIGIILCSFTVVFVITESKKSISKEYEPKPMMRIKVQLVIIEIITLGIVAVIYNISFIIFMIVTLILVFYIGFREIADWRYVYRKRIISEQQHNKWLEDDVAKRSLEINHINDALVLRANTDALTGLYNRMYMNDLMERYIKQRVPFTLMYLDLDNFKPINDLYGHLVGDELLVKIARKFYALGDDKFSLARYGGDEFVIVAKTIDKKVLQAHCDKLFEIVNQPIEIKGTSHSVGISIGVAYYPEIAISPENLLKYAEIAMYKAKRNPQDLKLVTYSVELYAEVERRNRIEQYLLNRNYKELLSITYQPIFSVKKGVVEIVEVRLSWYHDKEGEIKSKEFMPIAEDIGVAYELASWVLTEASQKFSQWKKYHRPDLRLCFVVSPTLFSIKEFIPSLRQKIKALEVDAKDILISISEHQMMASFEFLKQHLSTISALNIGVMIDDFGVGYSSLSYLKKINIEGIKISHELIEHIGKRSDDLLITNSIIMLAHGLGATVVAKGVGSQEQLTLIGETSCDYYQGFSGNTISAKRLEQQYFIDLPKEII